MAAGATHEMFPLVRKGGEAEDHSRQTLPGSHSVNFYQVLNADLPHSTNKQKNPTTLSWGRLPAVVWKQKRAEKPVSKLSESLIYKLETACLQ